MQTKILKDFFKNQNVVRFEPRLEGNKIYPDHIAIGDRAGKQVHVGNLLHEIAHFIEIDDKRCCQYGWGLTEGDFPISCQSLEREARVWAIQMVLCEEEGVEFPVREIAGLLDYFSSRLNLPSFPDGEEAMIDTVEGWILAERAKLTYPMLLQEWERKCKIAVDFFESHAIVRERPTLLPI